MHTSTSARITQCTIGFLASALLVAVAREPDAPKVEQYWPVAMGTAQGRPIRAPAGGGSTNLAPAAAAGGPLSLDACVRIALDKNPLRRAAQEGVVVAQHVVGEVRAAYYPDLTAQAGYGHWRKHAFLPSGFLPPGVAETIGPTDDWQAGLRARYTLLDFGERSAQLRQALAQRSVAQEKAAAVRQDIVLEVHRAFYAVVASQAAHTVAVSNLARAEDHYQLARNRQAGGVVPRTDVLRAQVDLSNAKLALVRAGNLVRLSRGNLNTAMALPVEWPVEVEPRTEPPTAPLDTASLAEAFQQAIHERPEVKGALQRIAAARGSVDAARSSFFPRIRGEASYFRRDNDFWPQDNEWLLGVTLEQPLFSGFVRQNKLAQNKAELSQAESVAQQEILRVREEVWSTHSKLQEAFEAIQAAEALVQHAEESLRSNRERYAAGAGIIADLLDAQTALTRAEVNLTEARWDYQVARAALRRATGEL